MAFKASTLNKIDRIAKKINPKRYLSIDGPKLVEIIKLLLPESNGQPASICSKLRAIGRVYKWDMPGIQTVPENQFLLWLVVEVAKTVALPVPVAPAAPGR